MLIFQIAKKTIKNSSPVFLVANLIISCSTNKHSPTIGENNTSLDEKKSTELNNNSQNSYVNSYDNSIANSDNASPENTNQNQVTNQTPTVQMRPDSMLTFQRNCYTSLSVDENKNTIYYVRNNVVLSLVAMPVQKVLQLTDAEPFKKDIPLTQQQADQIVSTSKISINFSGIPDGKYGVVITGPSNDFGGGPIDIKDGMLTSGGNIPVAIKMYASIFDDMSMCDNVENSSPLVVSLTNEEIRSTSIANGVQFDINGDGAKEQMAWIDNPESSMFLVLDKNNNGNIDDISEMFGNKTLGPDQKAVANGFLALAKYDLNSDEVIDEKDAIFNELRLWSDLNKNGISEEGELFTLQDKSVQAIHLNYSDVNEIDSYGNEVKQQSSIVLANDELREIVDIWFCYFVE